jgi:hypothetical protein
MAAKRRTGRPPAKVTDEQRQRARELLGVMFHRSRIAAALMKEFEIGRPTAYKAIEAAVAEFRAEIKGDDLLVVTVAGYIEVASNEKTKPRDKVQALNGLVKVLALDKLGKMLGTDDEVRRFLESVGIRRAARAGEKPTEVA